VKLCRDYLEERGISDDTVKLHRIELDDRLDHITVKDRLGKHLPKGVIEAIWFELFDSAGNHIGWIARPLPSIANHPKFLCPLGSSGLPYIAKGVYGLAFGVPIIGLFII
jgi:hypothetical protein